MWNKQKCKSCKYRGYLYSNNKRSLNNLYCAYAIKSGKGTPLKKMPDGAIIDTRGDDPDNCLLYKKSTKRQA